MRIARAVLVAVALLVCAGAPAMAQRKATEKDSLGAQMAAVSALRNFQYQYGILVRAPRDETRGAGVCEIRVSDFCYGPLNGRVVYGGIATYPAQRSLVTTNVNRMWRRTAEFYISRYMTELQRHQKVMPGDRWINSELMRMHIDHGYLGRAESAVDKCKDAGWWCSALGAYVMHTTGDWQRADSAWSMVLNRMTPEERCEWLDPTPVIADKELRQTLEEFTCPQLAEFAARFWWLSDPLYTKPGNERRSAHLSRVLSLIVDAATQDRAMATPAMVREGMVANLNHPAPVSLDKPMLRKCASFGKDTPVGVKGARMDMLMSGYPDLVMRLGVPFYCGDVQLETDCAPPFSCPPPPQLAQYPLSRQSFVPFAEAATDHLRSLATDWNLRDPNAYEFISGWTRTILDLSYQAAYFKRSDSARLVVASELIPDPRSLAQRAVINQMRAELWLQSDFDKPFVRATATGTTRVLFNFMVAPQRTLASIESDHARGPLGRVRFGSGPQEQLSSRVMLSDVLLFEEGPALPATLEQAAPRARPNTIVPAGGTTGLFWEIYGLRSGETPHVSVRVVRQEGREPLRLAYQRTPPTGVDVAATEWDETPAVGAAIEGRSVNLNLSALRRGRYTLSLVVTLPGQIAESVRTIEIGR